MIDKQFKTLDEQIEIFKHKGLVIEDEKYARMRSEYISKIDELKEALSKDDISQSEATEKRKELLKLIKC